MKAILFLLAIFIIFAALKHLTLNIQYHEIPQQIPDFPIHSAYRNPHLLHSKERAFHSPIGTSGGNETGSNQKGHLGINGAIPSV